MFKRAKRRIKRSKVAILENRDEKAGAPLFEKNPFQEFAPKRWWKLSSLPRMLQLYTVIGMFRSSGGDRSECIKGGAKGVLCHMGGRRSVTARARGERGGRTLFCPACGRMRGKSGSADFVHVKLLRPYPFSCNGQRVAWAFVFRVGGFKKR